VGRLKGLHLILPKNAPGKGGVFMFFFTVIVLVLFTAAILTDCYYNLKQPARPLVKFCRKCGGLLIDHIERFSGICDRCREPKKRKDNSKPRKNYNQIGGVK
jgi:ribosomal protein S27AE